MKERPILFSGEMVRAILDGRKTQTRRIVRPQPEQHVPCDERDDGWRWPSSKCRSMLDLSEMPSLCPLGVRGERLWVKETIERAARSGPGCARFAADLEPTVIDTWPWKRHVLTAIHTPRGASRITLEIVEVRVQRLQEITAADACDEGAAGVLDVGHPLRAECYEKHGTWTGDDRKDINGPFAGSVAAFATLWDSINGKRAPWSSNPWVWAITFRRIR